MGIFGKIFDKKQCDLCGGDIGLLGNRKLEDGNCCKECASKLSPWMTDRRQSTVEEIRQHLAYREMNKKQLTYIHPTKVMGNYTKIYLDENAGKFFVTRSTDWHTSNPDIIDLHQVSDCKIDIHESKRELYDKDQDGKSVHFDPPRYEFSYSFYINLFVDSPFFSEISFELSQQDPTDRRSPEYFDLERQADEIRCSLMPGVEPIGSYIAFEEEMREREEMRAKKEAMRENMAKLGNALKHGLNNARQQRVIRCDKCGWLCDDPDAEPKFCPQCGDPINFRDKM